MKRITTKKEYDAVKLQVEQLIAEATQKGMLEPEMDNEYTQKISELCMVMADYEDNVMHLFPLKQKSTYVPDFHYVFVSDNVEQRKVVEHEHVYS